MFCTCISIEYTCPSGYHLLKKNIHGDGDLLYGGSGVQDKESIDDCKEKCDNNEHCALFMYLHQRKKCDLWNEPKPSKIWQIDLTDDAVFCIKLCKYLIL